MPPLNLYGDLNKETKDEKLLTYLTLRSRWFRFFRNSTDLLIFKMVGGIYPPTFTSFNFKFPREHYQTVTNCTIVTKAQINHNLSSHKPATYATSSTERTSKHHHNRAQQISRTISLPSIFVQQIHLVSTNRLQFSISPSFNFDNILFPCSGERRPATRHHRGRRHRRSRL